MRKKKWKIIIAVLLAMWIGMFTTDYLLAASLQKPFFVIAQETADDGGSGTYRGLGYWVELELDGNVPEEEVVSVTMTMFGRVVAASIQ